MLNEYDLINEYTGKFHNFSKRVWPIYKRVELKFLNFRKIFVQNDWYLTLRPSKISAICTFNALNRYIKSQVLNKYHGNFKWFNLINEYERFFFKNFNRVWGKMSEYEGKRIGLSKRVYSFNRHLRVSAQSKYQVQIDKKGN